MAPENKSNSNKNNKRRKNYLPHNKPVKKGAYPLRPGVEGFFITCDGGREYQASQEAINVIDSFYDELVEGKVEEAELCKKPLNKIIKFADSDSSGSESDDADEEDTNNDHAEDKNDVLTGAVKDEIVLATSAGASGESAPEIKEQRKNGKPENDEKKEADESAPEINEQQKNGKPENDEKKEADESAPEINDNEAQPKNEKPENDEKKEAEAVEPAAKRQCVEADAPKCEKPSVKVEQKSVDKLIEEELKELGDKSKRRFNKLDTGCNGVVFIQMRKKDGDPSPKDIVHHMMTSLASTKKHVSRFLLRVLPVEVACYTSDEEIRRAIKPVIEKYFPVETQNPRKFSVLYDGRANTGVDRAKVIDAVAKSVPSLHKVDLANPDISIVVQIVKTICLIGVVEKYKEFAKYNLRQLSS